MTPQLGVLFEPNEQMFSSLADRFAWLQKLVDELPPTWAPLAQAQRWPLDESTTTGGALLPQIES